MPGSRIIHLQNPRSLSREQRGSLSGAIELGFDSEERKQAYNDRESVNFS
jgi:hypothetical protein